jgi:hypothetical protein
MRKVAATSSQAGREERHVESLMVASIKAAPPYSQVFIEDQDGGLQPKPSRELVIRATSFCINVPCLTYSDGETLFTLGLSSEVDPGTPARFVGFLKTPSKRIAVRTAELGVLLGADVATTNSLVQVWTNDELEPDEVIIGFDI